MKQLLRYCAVGIVNSGVGYAIFWILLRVFGLTPGISNAVTYALALCLSFALNRRFVFDFGGPGRGAAVRFVLAFAVAFGINQLTLLGLLKVGLRAEFAQIGAMAAYTIVFYFLSKFFVFRSNTTTTATHLS